MAKPTQYKVLLMLVVCFVYLTSCVQEDSIQIRKSILKGVKVTDRISSNHYAELVKDSDGNAYVACFEKKEDAKDYMLVSKLNSNGVTVWELANENRGRATAISINEKNNIVVAGWFHRNMQLGDKTIENDLNGQSFIAEITPEGKCIKLSPNNADGIFNIHVNEAGEKLVSGIVSDRIVFNGAVFNNNENKQVNFLAYFNKKGKCKWIKKYDGQITSIKSHENDFYLTGKFSEQFVFGSDTLKTKASYDSDGFIHKVSQQGISKWIRSFGLKNNYSKISYADETGCDLAFDKNNDVLLCALVCDTTNLKLPNLNIIKYSIDGNLISKKEIVKKAHDSIYTFTKDANNHYWLTGSVKNTLFLVNSSWKTFAPVNAYILKLDSALECEEVLLPKHGPNTLFRSAFYGKEHISFTGHYKSYFSHKEDSIFNAGKNELFFYSIPTDNPTPNK